MATRRITYLDPSPKYMRTRSSSTASIMSTRRFLGSPGTKLTPEPNYISESAQRVRIPTAPLPSNITQLQDLPRYRLQGIRTIDTSAGTGAYGPTTQEGIDAFELIGKKIGKTFFPKKDKSTQQGYG